MGGIVAQRLEENGFVKFANGFTIQWGYKKSVYVYDGTTYPITFPTAFNNECSGVWPSIEHKTSLGGNEVFYHTNKSTTGFTLVADASHAPYTVDGVVYLAIGH